MKKRKAVSFISVEILILILLVFVSACRSRTEEKTDTTQASMLETETVVSTDDSTAIEINEGSTVARQISVPDISAPEESDKAESMIPTLTDIEVFELWKTANTVYAEWFVLPESEIVNTNDYFSDEGTDGVPAYRVISDTIHNKQELSQYLSRFFESEVYEKSISSNRIREKEGALYLVAGGIGSDGMDVKSVVLKTQNEDEAIIEVTYYDHFTDTVNTMDLILHYREGKWLFSSPFICFYDNLNYESVMIGASKSMEAES